MRTQFLLRKHNIGLYSLQLACRFLNLSIVQISSQLSDEKIRLLEITLNSEKFENWIKLKKQIEIIETPDRLSLIEFLNSHSKETIDELLAERILNALSIEIGLKRYNEEIIEKIQSVMQSKLTLFEKISELKSVYPFHTTNSKSLTEKEWSDKILELENIYKSDVWDLEEAIKDLEEDRKRIIDKEESDEALELEYKNRRDKRDDWDSEEAIMRGIGNGEGDLFGF